MLKDLEKDPRKFCLKIKSLYKELVGAQGLKGDSEFQHLVSSAFRYIQVLTDVNIPEIKGWGMQVNIPSTSCNNCSTCREVKLFFADQSLESKQFLGQNVTWKGHVTIALENLVRNSGCGFKIQKLSTKASKVNGRILITKTLQQRTPINQIPKIQELKKQLVWIKQCLKSYVIFQRIWVVVPW